MAVNYTITNVPITVSPSSDWGSQDIPLPGATTGDGVPDGGGMPLRMIISPTNPSTHTVSMSSFTIAGMYSSTGGPANNLYPGWDSGSITIKNWDDGQSLSGDEPYIDLPQGVNKVTMYDTGTPGEVGNTVVVLAYLDSNYQTSTSNTTITLDIDGDADQVTSTLSPGAFNINVKLMADVDGNSNCTVVPYTPVLSSDQLEYYIPSVTTTGGTTGTILCTPGGGNNTWFQQYDTAVAWFYIVPNDGFTLSRHNLSVATVGGSTTGINCNGQYLPDGNDSNVTWLATIEATNLLNQGIGIPDSPFPMPQALEGWPWYTMTSYENAEIQLDGESFNYNDIPLYTTVTNIPGDNILLVDTSGGPFSTYNLLDPEIGGDANILDLWGSGCAWGNGIAPNYSCPIDYQGNAVLVVLNGWNWYIPGVSTPEITIPIYGSAMVDDGSECVDWDVSLEG